MVIRSMIWPIGNNHILFVIIINGHLIYIFLLLCCDCSVEMIFDSNICIFLMNLFIT